MAYTEQEKELLNFIEKHIGKDARKKLESDRENFLKFKDEVGNIDPNNHYHLVDAATRLNEQMLGVDPRQTGGNYLVFAAMSGYLNGNQNALVDYDPNKTLTALDQLNKPENVHPQSPFKIKQPGDLPRPDPYKK